MTDWDPEAWTRNLIADMRAHGGRPSSGPMAGKPRWAPTSKGAKSGEDRIAVVTYHREGQWLVDRRLEVAALPRTLPGTTTCSANPDATVEVDNQLVPVRAREATGDERDRLWNEHVAQLPEFGEYPEEDRSGDPDARPRAKELIGETRGSPDRGGRTRPNARAICS